MMLKEMLSEWADFDVAQYYLACSLGLMAYDKSFDNFRSAKHVFWGAHPVGDMLSQMLRMMAENHILEYDSDGWRYRWNPAYKGSWQKEP